MPLTCPGVRHAVCLLFAALATLASAADGVVRTIAGLAYRAADEPDEYARTRCRLDLYLPAEAKGFPCLVWFHGGGIEAGSRQGERQWATAIARHGIAVAAADYRLSPKATYPAYIQDAAAAVAWVHAHIAEHGGDARRVFVGGHSAGGYLAAMVTLDKRWLTAAGMDPKALAGAVPVSGQMITHSTVRKERGIPRTTEVVDHAAPLTHARANAPPMLLITGDKDMAGRSEENRRLRDALVKAGCTAVRFQEFPDRDHGTIKSRMMDDRDPARAALIAFITGDAKKP